MASSTDAARRSALTTAVRGKRLGPAIRRAATIAGRLGPTTTPMRRRITRLVDVSAAHGCPVSLFVPADVLERHRDVLLECVDRDGVELSPHGATHVDHWRLSRAEQAAGLRRASDRFARAGRPSRIHRAPYLRPPDGAALRSAGFVAEAGFGRYWPDDVAPVRPYRHALEFYGAQPVEGPLLPEIVDDVVHIPYCLPDDEALIERLRADRDEQAAIWTAMLERTLQSGGLLVLGVHPERIDLVGGALDAVLGRAEVAGSRLWRCAMTELVTWWRSRSDTGPTWPGGATAALCVTGDIDAMSAVDYPRCVLGR